MRKVLITGGAGFVGRHFCQHFLEQGDMVYCVDPIVPLTGGIHPFVEGQYHKTNWPSINLINYKRNFAFYKMDCREFFKSQVVGPPTPYDLVLHLAAIVGGREMIENNPIAVADDLSIDAAFWQWAVIARPKKVIYFSSSAAYPIKYQAYRGWRFLREDHIDFNNIHKGIGMPDMSYGWAKLTGEYQAKLAYEKHEIKSIVYRPFSGYGEDQHKNYPFPSICQRLYDSLVGETFRVWGSGNQMRDFIHIDDVVRGVITTMDRIDDASALNLSTGRYLSFKKIAQIGSKMLKKNLKIIGNTDKPEGVYARAGDITKQECLGFSGRITLEEGMERMFKYLIQRSVNNKEL